MKLNELIKEYEDLFEALDYVESDQEREQIISEMQELEIAVETKIENVAKVIKRLNADIATWESEEKRLKKQRTAMEKSVFSLQCWLGTIMGKNKLKTPSIEITGHLDSSVVYDSPVSQVPEQYLRKVERVEIDKPKVTKALDEGELLSFAHRVYKKRVK